MTSRANWSHQGLVMSGLQRDSPLNNLGSESFSRPGGKYRLPFSYLVISRGPLLYQHMVKVSNFIVLVLVVVLASGGARAASGFGSVSFATSCSPSVAAPFNEAVAVLHSFWHAPSLI